MGFDVLIPAERLAQRISEMAVEVDAAFDERPAILAVLEGARTFANALCARLPGTPFWHGLPASSYQGTESSGKVAFGLPTSQEMAVVGRRVLVLEDIVDTGRTVEAVNARLLSLGAREVCWATLLSKPARRVVDCQVAWTGFEIADEFVVGFGLDLDGAYRDLDHVAIYPRGNHDHVPR